MRLVFDSSLVDVIVRFLVVALVLAGAVGWFIFLPLGRKKGVRELIKRAAVVFANESEALRTGGGLIGLVTTGNRQATLVLPQGCDVTIRPAVRRTLARIWRVDVTQIEQEGEPDTSSGPATLTFRPLKRS